MNIFFVLLFVYYKNKRTITTTTKYAIPWQIPFFFISLSVLVSSILSIAGISSELSSFIKYLFENILLLWVIWEVVDSEDDLAFLFKVITFIMFASCMYGFIEYFLQTNPLQLYEATLNTDASRNVLSIYTTADRGYRINSIFEHAIGAGINWSIYAGFIFYNLINNENDIRLTRFSIITGGLCFICVILTKMRSPLIFLIICLFGGLNFKKKKNYLIVAFLLLVATIVVPFLDKNSDTFQVFYSLFSQASQSHVGGSNLEGRLSQLSVAIELFKRSPIVGLGVKYNLVLDRSVYVGLNGAESVWFYVLPSFGIFGLITYIVNMIYSVWCIPKHFKSRQLMFLMLAYWATYTVSSVPGMKLHLLYLFAFYLIKTSKRYKNLIGPRKKEYSKGIYNRLYRI